MKLKATREPFLKALQHCCDVSRAKSPNPVMARVLLTALNGHVFMRSTDFTLHARAEVADAEVVKNGDTSVNAQDLLQRVRALPNNSLFSLAVTEDKLGIAVDKIRFALRTVDHAAFPPPPTEPPATALTTIVPAHALAAMLKRVIPAAHTDPTNVELSSVQLEFNPGALAAVATDRRRIAKVEFEPVEYTPKGYDAACARGTEPTTALLALRHAQLLQKFADGAPPEQELTLSVTTNAWWATAGLSTISGQLVAAQFQPYKALLGMPPYSRCTVLTAQLLAAVHRVSLASSADRSAVTLRVVGKKLHVSAEDTETGDRAEDELAADCSSPTDFCGEYNHSYLRDLLLAVSTESVELGLPVSVNQGPLGIQPVDATDFSGCVAGMGNPSDVMQSTR